MKKILLFMCLFLFGCQQYQASALVVTTQRPMTNTAQPTRTPVPSATIDYQKTAEVAQGTADEARRINAQATAQHETNLIEAAKITSIAEQNEMIRLGWTAQSNQWTATLAATSIPLTSTAQKVADTQVAIKTTSTHEAPALAQQMVNVEYQKKYGNREHTVGIALGWIVVLSGIALIVFLFCKWNHEDRKLRLEEKKHEQEQKPKVMDGKYMEDKGQGFYGIHPKKIIPCTREQFIEFAEAITQGTKTMGINEWEGADTSFTRDLYIPFHSWIRENKFGLPNSRNGLDATNELMELLGRFLETGDLPTEYQFLPENDAKSVDSGAKSSQVSDKPFINHTNI